MGVKGENAFEEKLKETQGRARLGVGKIDVQTQCNKIPTASNLGKRWILLFCFIYLHLEA